MYSGAGPGESARSSPRRRRRLAGGRAGRGRGGRSRGRALAPPPPRSPASRARVVGGPARPGPFPRPRGRLRVAPRGLGRAGRPACRPEARAPGPGARSRCARRVAGLARLGGRRRGAAELGRGRARGRAAPAPGRAAASLGALSFVLLPASTSAAPSPEESLERLNFGQFLSGGRTVDRGGWEAAPQNPGTACISFSFQTRRLLIQVLIAFYNLLEEGKETCGSP